MTADIRAAAQSEADSQYPETPFAPENEHLAEAFEAGAVWGAARVAPTREQLKAAATKAWDDWWAHDGGKSYQDAMADAMLALMQELEEGEG